MNKAEIAAFAATQTSGARRLSTLKGIHMSTLEKDQIQASDSLIKRNRLGRIMFFVLSAGATVLGLGLLIEKFIRDWFGLSYVGLVIGLCLGAVLFFLYLYDRMIVVVESQRAFLTIDMVRAFLKFKEVYVTYGPGFHISYPWEQRLARNNVSLVEATENFSLSVVTKTGIVTVKGSYRLRPRLKTESLVAFLGGVAALAEDLADLVKAKITPHLATKTVDNISKQIKPINDFLADHFGTGPNPADPEVSDFEDRFGVVVGDVTVAEITLSEDAIKTRNAIDETVQFAKGVALILGYSSPRAMQKALKESAISQADVETARKQFLALSENVTMKVEDWTFNIKGLEGLDPKAAEALAQAARAYASTIKPNK